MCVIVAIKSGDAIYMGCDTQTTSGKDKENKLHESTFKISKLRSGMLVGICGKVVAHQSVCDDESVFEIEKCELTKKEIVNNIIPKIKAKLKDIAGDTSENERIRFKKRQKKNYQKKLIRYVNNVTNKFII